MTRPDPRSRVERRRGFTLVELLVALAIGAIVLLGARLMVEGVADGARRIVRQAARTDRDANAERVLRTVVAALDATTTGTSFGGDEREARFTSWCDVPGGWQERCSVTLAIGGGTGTGDSAARTLILTLSGAEPLRIRAGFVHGGLRYLDAAHDGGQWFGTWEAGLTVPIAIGAILDADTLIFKVGDRG